MYKKLDCPNFFTSNFNFMQNFLSSNIKFLREKNNVSQTELGLQLNKVKQTISHWEQGKGEPSASELYRLATFFGLSVNELVLTKLDDGNYSEKQKIQKNIPKGNLHGNYQGNYSDEKPPVLVVKESKVPYQAMPKTITVDSSGKENILLVPVKARAGYLLGYGDAEYLRTLPAFTLPGYNNGTYRMFEVQGQSMFNTFNDGDRCIARWAGISEIKDGRVYVLITTDGILVKRCLNRLESGVIIAKSDNNYGGEYPNQVIQAEDIKEVWYVVEKLTRHLPEPGEIYKRLHQLEGDVTILKEQLKAR